MLPVNFLVILFLMTVMYIASTANTSFWISACSAPSVLWKTRRFFSYWCFSSSWALWVAAIGMMSFFWMDLTNKGIFGEDGISGRADH